MPERREDEIRLAETRLRGNRDLAEARVRPAEGRTFVGRVGPPGPAELWAKITGGDQADGFTWDEQEGTASGSRWRDKTDGRNSTDDGPAYLTRDIIAEAACVGCVVRLTRVRIYNLETEEYEADWWFEPPLPAPGDQYQGLYVDADGKWDVDWLHLV